MNAVEESMRETLNSWSTSHAISYKEKQWLKQADVQQQISFVLSAVRRHERRAWWFVVGYLILTLVIGALLAFSAATSLPTMSTTSIVLCIGLFNRGQMLRDASIALAKMETLADLWLRQNQSSLAKFDQSNKAIVTGLPETS